MSSYPDEIIDYRLHENRDGSSFNVNESKRIYAEDLTNIEDEIIAIETELGTDVKGGSATLKARLENETVLSGWGYVSWSGSISGKSITVNLPSSFDDTNYKIIAWCIGYKNGSNPTSNTDVTGLQDIVTWGYIINSSSFKLEFKKFDNANVNSAYRTLYNYIAIGKKTL